MTKDAEALVVVAMVVGVAQFDLCRIEPVGRRLMLRIQNVTTPRVTNTRTQMLALEVLLSG